MKYDYNSLVEQLQNSVVTVTFEKVDGSMRTMRCTLIPSYLPKSIAARLPC